MQNLFLQIRIHCNQLLFKEIFCYSLKASLPMSKLNNLILVFALLSIAKAVQQCNNTHLQFLSQYSLGKQDQLNKTFTRLQKQFPPVPSIQFNATPFAKYTIFNTTVSFYYRDSKQKAEIIDDDIIFIYGGYLQIDFKFNWTLKSFSGETSGTAQGMGLSGQIMFGKEIVIDKGFYVYTLVDPRNLKATDQFKLRRVLPQSATKDDIDALSKMVNEVPQNGSLKQFIIKHINENYIQYLNQSLHDQKYHPNQEYDYIWEDPEKGKLIVNYTMHPTGITVNKKGLKMTYSALLDNFPEFKCGNYSVPSQQWDSKVYGGTQQFISLTIAENTVRYAKQKGFFNSVLNKQKWESRFFQFYAGDLYQVIPKVANTFAAQQIVNGSCYATNLGYDFKKYNSSTLEVTVEYDCTLQIKSTNIMQIKTRLSMLVEGKAQSKYLDFHILQGQIKTIQFIGIQGFNLQNQKLAILMVENSLTRLKQTKVLGSGWKVFTRDYPHLKIEDGYIAVYDSTHVAQQTKTIDQ